MLCGCETPSLPQLAATFVATGSIEIASQQSPKLLCQTAIACDHRAVDSVVKNMMNNIKVELKSNISISLWPYGSSTHLVNRFLDESIIENQ